MRFFTAPVAVLDAIRTDVRSFLEQPNGAAEEPWPAGGDFAVVGLAYLALAPHHTEGEPWAALVAQGLATPGVVEIGAAEYFAAQPADEA